MILEIIIITILYVAIMTSILYYYILFESKDIFLKEELINILPFYKQFIGKALIIFKIPLLLLIFIATSSIGILLVLLFENWIINSALFPTILFLILPSIKKHFEDTQVSISENYTESVMTIVLHYSPIITIGFSSGVAGALIYNWAVYNVIHFIWMFLNIIVVSVITILTMKKIMD